MASAKQMAARAKFKAMIASKQSNKVKRNAAKGAVKGAKPKGKPF